jgi:DNA-binding NtrC family response regulator
MEGIKLASEWIIKLDAQDRLSEINKALEGKFVVLKQQQIITLILDDDPTVEEFFNKFFNIENMYNVQSFNNPNEFKRAITNEVKLVMLDISLPGFMDYNIIEMITYLHKFFPGIYIIIVSGYLDIKNMKDFLRTGVFDVVDKNDTDWQADMKSALDRVNQKILFKANALSNLPQK